MFRIPPPGINPFEEPAKEETGQEFEPVDPDKIKRKVEELWKTLSAFLAYRPEQQETIGFYDQIIAEAIAANVYSLPPEIVTEMLLARLQPSSKTKLPLAYDPNAITAAGLRALTWLTPNLVDQAKVMAIASVEFVSHMYHTLRKLAREKEKIPEDQEAHRQALESRIQRLRKILIQISPKDPVSVSEQLSEELERFAELNSEMFIGHLIELEIDPPEPTQAEQSLREYSTFLKSAFASELRELGKKVGVDPTSPQWEKEFNQAYRRVVAGRSGIEVNTPEQYRQALEIILRRPIKREGSEIVSVFNVAEGLRYNIPIQAIAFQMPLLLEVWRREKQNLIERIGTQDPNIPDLLDTRTRLIILERTIALIDFLRKLPELPGNKE